ncbi:MAG: hypothetical protein COY40_00270 [Alphaproteobacteria bacterium CG_4_10_14_0_8_um_filter_53_9]|nr:MAG: hypothetical protein COY40_00270 [Alphaproteobacteria bacterium CG_4_10_14_0_8_um_filter_53_9]
MKAAHNGTQKPNTLYIREFYEFLGMGMKTTTTLCLVVIGFWALGIAALSLWGLYMAGEGEEIRDTLIHPQFIHGMLLVLAAFGLPNPVFHYSSKPFESFNIKGSQLVQHAKQPHSPASVMYVLNPAKKIMLGLFWLKDEEKMNRFARSYTLGRDFTQKEKQDIYEALQDPYTNKEEIFQKYGCHTKGRNLHAWEQLIREEMTPPRDVLTTGDLFNLSFHVVREQRRISEVLAPSDERPESPEISGETKETGRQKTDIIENMKLAA